LDKRCDNIDIYYYNYPQIITGNINVTNPKDVVTAALPSVANLQSTILARQMDLMMGQWTGPTDDLLQVISMPVFLLVQAVQAMQSAKEQAEAEKKEEDTDLILEILGIVFAFIPFLDDITPAIEGLVSSLLLSRNPSFPSMHLTIRL
jgi:glucan 1,3-beta-glucosidase